MTDTADVLLTAGKKKRKDKSEDIAPEIVEAAKKISKTERKRLDQIKLRKDKEEKRDQYLNLLNQHVMPDSHRQLLTSSQNIGQNATMKSALKKAFKRHKAGLSITAEEHELLFPEGNQQVRMQEGAVIFSYSHLLAFLFSDTFRFSTPFSFFLPFSSPFLFSMSLITALRGRYCDFSSVIQI